MSTLGLPVRDLKKQVRVPDSFDLHVALFGVGNWGRNHARVLSSISANLTIADADMDVAASVVGDLGDNTTDGTTEQVLGDPSVDAVVIATPASTHYELARDCLLAGKHVLIEKPLALNPKDGAELIRLADERNKVLMVGHLLRYHPAVETLIEMTSAGELGDLLYVYSTRLNMGKVRQEENALWSFAPHDVSVISAVLNEQPRQVSCTGRDYLQNGVPDVSLSSMSYKSGKSAHIFVSWLHPFKEQRLVVVGSEKMVVFEDSRPENKLVEYVSDVGFSNGVLVARLTDGVPIHHSDEEALLREDRHFLQCVVGNKRPLTDGKEGLAVLKILDACQRSIGLDGAPVKIDSEPAERIDD